MVDRAALEMRCRGNSTGGSNPSFSATRLPSLPKGGFFYFRDEPSLLERIPKIEKRPEPSSGSVDGLLAPPSRDVQARSAPSIPLFPQPATPPFGGLLLSKGKPRSTTLRADRGKQKRSSEAARCGLLAPPSRDVQARSAQSIPHPAPATLGNLREIPRKTNQQDPSTLLGKIRIHP